MSGKGKARRWFKEHSSDLYVKQANAAGYRSRAAYKLLELDQRERLLRKGMTVLDLGCAPGGWSQVAASKVHPGGCVVAVDLLEMPAIEGVSFVRGDFGDEGVRAKVMNHLPGCVADVVISDMAPNLTGVRISDQAACEAQALQVMEFALQVLRPGAMLVLKVFQGSGLNPLLERARADFERVRIKKPRASRARSAEGYLLATSRGGILSK